METYGNLWRPMETYGDLWRQIHKSKARQLRQTEVRRRWDDLLFASSSFNFNAGLAPYFYIALLILTGTPNEDNA